MWIYKKCNSFPLTLLGDWHQVDDKIKLISTIYVTHSIYFVSGKDRSINSDRISKMSDD